MDTILIVEVGSRWTWI